MHPRSSRSLLVLPFLAYHCSLHHSWEKSTASLLEQLLDTHANLEGVDFNTLLPYYKTAMKLEYDFFDYHKTLLANDIEQQEARKISNISLFGLDFDETCTSADTTAFLPLLGIKATEDKKGINPGVESLGVTLS